MRGRILLRAAFAFGLVVAAVIATPKSAADDRCCPSCCHNECVRQGGITGGCQVGGGCYCITVR